MKRFFIFLYLFNIYQLIYCQDVKETGYVFTDLKEVNTTSVKNQHQSGTCWSYSALSFLESELLRKGKPEFDFSEMWIVRHTYSAKAEKYIRMQGNINFSAGGSFEDVFWVMRNYGIVPQEIYEGLNYGEEKNVHRELDAITKSYVDALLQLYDDASSKGRSFYLSTAWMKGFDGIMDAYLGKRPERFSYKGKEYTPDSFMQSLQLDLDDYVSITSFTHHPFYEPFIIEIPDNWIWGSSYNVPMEELLEIATHALQNGYSVLWGSDVSEKGFKYRKGVAVVPQTNFEEISDSDKARWIGLSEKDLEKRFLELDQCVPEIKVTQEMRQKGFDNFLTTDDHGMHITGISKNQDGSTFFKVKNSWGADDSKYNGYFYVSESFFLYKTINIVVHKNSIPKNILKKLNLK